VIIKWNNFIEGIQSVCVANGNCSSEFQLIRVDGKKFVLLRNKYYAFRLRKVYI